MTPKDVIAQAEKEFRKKFVEIEALKYDSDKLKLYQSFLSSYTKDLLQARDKEIIQGIRGLESNLQGHMAYTAVERILDIINNIQKE